MNPKFLREVARYYRDRCDDLADLTFVCPNKRSAMFLKRHFQKLTVGAAVFMPRFVAFPAWIARMAPRPVPDRWEALFLLFTAYRNVLARHGRADRAGDFDRFIFWGDIIMSDFDDIDRSLAEAADVYTNLHRLRSIQADYLTPEQKEVIRLLWGDTPMTRDIDSFWFHTGPGRDGDSDDSSLSGRFMALWEVLGELYAEFRQLLDSKGMATAGMQSRLALEKVKERPLDDFAAEGRKYVFTGLSEIYPAELAILERYRDAGVAEFIWDTAVADIYDDAASMPPGIGAVRRLAAHLPQPDDFPDIPGPERRTINITGIPSAVAQTKLAGEIVARIMKESPSAGSTSVNTAIVVPDPSLLMPLMLALPPELPALNVTMALPYSQTTFATLLRAVVSMQSRIRRRRGEWTFFYADVLEIVAHPHVKVFAPDASDIIKRHIAAGALYNIPATDILRLAPSLAFIFEPVAEPGDMEAVYAYLRGFISGLYTALRRKITSAYSENSLELQCLEALLGKLETLRRLMTVYDIDMGESTLFMIFERLLASGLLTMSGTPLKGLQVMGALETRALDFDNIIYISLNERTFSRRDSIRTMIPAALRRGYGLPRLDRDETAMNYHFYRSISRAERSWLIYDSRPAALGGAEVSRYITQILYGPLSHADGITVTHDVVDLGGEQPSRRGISVEKTPRVLDELARYRTPGSGRRLSASALKEYMKCPLAFYLKYVKGYRSDEPPTDALTPAEAGDIFHGTMQDLYGRYRGRLITAEVIDELLAGDTIREALMRQYVLKRPSAAGLTFDRLPAEGIIVLSTIRLQIEGMLEAEKAQYVPFYYHAGEDDGAEFEGMWRIAPDVEVCFTMKIDRIDRLADDSGFRFIDYKTGSDSMTVGSDFDNLFDGRHEYQAIFQLMLYREAYADMCGYDGPVDLRLHCLHKIMTDGSVAELKFDKKPICGRPELRDMFRARLTEIVRRIFDSSTPFTQADDQKKCTFCQFQGMCNRQIPSDTDR